METILIADDDLQIRTLLSQFFTNSGYETLVAANGLEAIRHYESGQPDLVITDILMPEKDGIETIMDLKKMDPAVKIIAISGGGACSAGNYLSLAEKLGAVAVFEKPFNLKELLLHIRAALHER